MLKLLALPTWVAVRTIIWLDVLPIYHPLSRLPMPLWVWYGCQSKLCQLFDGLLWCSIIIIITALSV